MTSQEKSELEQLLAYMYKHRITFFRSRLNLILDIQNQKETLDK